MSNVQSPERSPMSNVQSRMSVLGIGFVVLNMRQDDATSQRQTLDLGHWTSFGTLDIFWYADPKCLTTFSAQSGGASRAN